MRCGRAPVARAPVIGSAASEGAPFVARRAVDPHGCAPASRGPLPKRPCTERVDAPLPARRPTEAYPQRYGEGGNEAGADAAALECRDLAGMDPWRPASLRPCSFGFLRRQPGAL